MSATSQPTGIAGRPESSPPGDARSGCDVRVTPIASANARAMESTPRAAAAP